MEINNSFALSEKSLLVDLVCRVRCCGLPRWNMTGQDGSELDCVQGLGGVGTDHGSGPPQARSAQYCANFDVGLPQDHHEEPVENHVRTLGLPCRLERVKNVHLSADIVLRFPTQDEVNGAAVAVCR